jgi:hypothetical protein
MSRDSSKDHYACDLSPTAPLKHRIQDGNEPTNNHGDSKMLNKTTIALAAALILGTASAVMAGDSDENNKGGAVVPGSTVGVNPVDHPNNPAAQSPRQPMSPDKGIRTEGRGSAEGLREQKEGYRTDKDPQDPGPDDSKK